MTTTAASFMAIQELFGFGAEPEPAFMFDASATTHSVTSSPPPGSPPSPPNAPSRPRGKAATASSMAKASKSKTQSRAKASQANAATQKRARRSEIERQSRLRRLDELTRKREELMRLEWEYKKVADQEGLEQLVFETKPETSVAIVSAKSLREKQTIHRRLAFIAQLLDEEQNQLRKLLQEQALFQDAVQSAWRCDLSEETLAASAAPSRVSDHPSYQNKEWVHPARCFAFLRETYELIHAFDGNHDFVTTGASIMGWTDKRRIDETTGHLHYGFRKQLLGQRAETILAKSWDVLRDAESMYKLLVDPTVTTKFHTLQVVNDDLLLIRRDHTHPPMPLVFLTVHVLFRLQTPQGFLLCFRTMPIPEIQASLEPHEMWFDILNWTMFNHMYDGNGNIIGCEVVVGGSLGDPSNVTAKHWLFELIISVLKWESLCVAPLFIMSS